MSHNCEKCPEWGRMQRLGVDMGDFDRVVALAGNPNTGKSTVFNALTGLKQHTGNWPGKTVTRAEGGFTHDGVHYKLVDLPGTYSLLSASTDEQVARDFLLLGQPDCTIVVLDATAIERNLNLALQVMEITPRVVVAVNLLDEARRKGIEVDIEALAEELGVPVVGIIARRRHGFDKLLPAVADVASGKVVPAPRLPPTPAKLQAAIDELVPMIDELVPNLTSPRWLAYRLLEGDHSLRQALLEGRLAELADEIQGRKAPEPKVELTVGGKTL